MSHVIDGYNSHLSYSPSVQIHSIRKDPRVHEAVKKYLLDHPSALFSVADCLPHVEKVIPEYSRLAISDCIEEHINPKIYMGLFSLEEIAAIQAMNAAGMHVEQIREMLSSFSSMHASEEYSFYPPGMYRSLYSVQQIISELLPSLSDKRALVRYTPIGLLFPSIHILKGAKEISEFSHATADISDQFTSYITKGADPYNRDTWFFKDRLGVQFLITDAIVEYAAELEKMLSEPSGITRENIILDRIEVRFGIRFSSYLYQNFILNSDPKSCHYPPSVLEEYFLLRRAKNRRYDPVDICDYLRKVSDDSVFGKRLYPPGRYRDIRFIDRYIPFLRENFWKRLQHVGFALAAIEHQKQLKPDCSDIVSPEELLGSIGASDIAPLPYSPFSYDPEIIRIRGAEIAAVTIVGKVAALDDISPVTDASSLFEEASTEVCSSPGFSIRSTTSSPVFDDME